MVIRHLDKNLIMCFTIFLDVFGKYKFENEFLTTVIIDKYHFNLRVSTY